VGSRRQAPSARHKQASGSESADAKSATSSATDDSAADRSQDHGGSHLSLSKENERAVLRAASLLVLGQRDAPLGARTLRRAAIDAGCETSGPVEVAAGTWAFACPSGAVRLWHRAPTAVETREALALRGITRSTRPTARTSIVTPPKKVSAERARVGRLFGGGN
jgi:hypothetical protein